MIIKYTVQFTDPITRVKTQLEHYKDFKSTSQFAQFQETELLYGREVIENESEVIINRQETASCVLEEFSY